MTPTEQAARVLANVERYGLCPVDGKYISKEGNWVRYDDALAAIARHLAAGDDLVAQAEAVLSPLSKLADDMDRHATDDWDESELICNAGNVIRALLARLSALTARVSELEAALSKIDVGEGWAAIIARTALKKAGRK